MSRAPQSRPENSFFQACQAYQGRFASASWWCSVFVSVFPPPTTLFDVGIFSSLTDLVTLCAPDQDRRLTGVAGETADGTIRPYQLLQVTRSRLGKFKHPGSTHPLPDHHQPIIPPPDRAIATPGSGNLRTRYTWRHAGHARLGWGVDPHRVEEKVVTVGGKREEIAGTIFSRKKSRKV